MISIRDFRQFCEGVILNKDQSGRMRTPDFNLAVESASNWKLVESTDDIKDYKPGQPVGPIAWQKSRMVTEILRHLLIKVPIWPTSQGLIDLPDNLFYTSDVRMPYFKCPGDCTTAEDWTRVPYHVQVKIVDNDEMANILSNDLVRPTMRYPFGEFIGDTIQVYPTNVPVVLLSYIRYPNTPRYGVTILPSGREVFDPATSVDIDWPMSCFNDLAFKTLEFMGINIRDIDVTQFSDSKERSGT